MKVPEDIEKKIFKFEHSDDRSPDGVIKKFTIESDSFLTPLHYHFRSGNGSKDVKLSKEFTREEALKSFGMNLRDKTYYSMQVSCGGEIRFTVNKMTIWLINPSGVANHRDIESSSCTWQIRNMFPMDIKVTIEVYDMFKLCKYNFSQTARIEQLQQKLNVLEKQTTLCDQEVISNHLSKVEERITRIEQLLVRDTEHKDSQCDTDESFSTASSTPTPSLRNDDVSNRVILEEIKSIKALLYGTRDEPSW